MRGVAIIPCRAGSKGIPRKNRMEFNGLPLFMWSVAAALEDERVRTACITTDDAEIISWGQWASEKEGRIVCINRPSEMAADDSPTEPCMFHACRDIGVMNHEFVLLLQPTSPVRHGGLVSRCIDRAGVIGSSFSCFCPGHIAWLQTGTMSVPLYNPIKRPRRQELEGYPKVMIEDGSVYCSLYDQMVMTGTRFGSSPSPMESDFIHGVQIDTLEDAKTLRHLCADEAVKLWMEKVQLLLPR